uniref:[phosphatase 2A protein]-leucine-carboxy methyltransferase n=1 Tax=Macrostomum lignano TaxID=282301 RepID=A0A1I8GNN6_9PLAT
MSEKQVQGTNDSSIVSKASAVERGYFDDPFVSLMVRKRARRAPLINRGYYIRMKAMDQALQNFISATSSEGQTRYIISLGAGFDTAYFRLKSKGLLDGIYYIEIDYYDVVANKARLIQQSELLTTVIVVRSADYCLVASDLTHEPVLAACLRELIPDWTAPALFFSECVLTYVAPKHADRLINWISQEFPCSVFLLCQHFKGLGSRLKCIEKYPYLADQRERFSVGWQRVEALDMNAFYRSLDLAERCRVEHLEVFDEFEEWWAKCEHYFVLAAHTAGFRHRHHRARLLARRHGDCGEEEEAVAEPPCWRVQQGLSQQPLGNLTRVPVRPLPGGCADQFRLHWTGLSP